MAEVSTPNDNRSSTIDDAVRLFNDREYFACHDVLEELWGDTIGHDRDFLQGLLHVAVCLHHLSEGNPAGARKMHASSLKYLRDYGSEFQGIDLDRLRAELADCFLPLRDGINAAYQTPEVDTLPQLHRSGEHE